MSIMALTVTIEELLRMPDDGYRYELVKGELRKMPPAGGGHGKAAMRFGWRLAQYVEAHNLGVVYAAETGFILATNPDTVRAPDVAFVAKDRLPEDENAPGYLYGPPNLAVEVISPNDTYQEVEEKAIEWLNAGTRIVIIANPRNRVITVHRSLQETLRLTETDELTLEEIIPGWRVPVRDLFG